MDSINEITTFWDRYETGGIDSAVSWLHDTYGNLKALEGDVQSLINEARERDINIIQFLKELDNHMLVERKDDTNGTPDDGRELSDVSCDVNGSSKDETESTEARHDDSGTNGTEQSG